MTEAGDYLDRIRAAHRTVDAHDCRTRGHDWTLTFVVGSQFPQQIYCTRNCGAPTLRVEQPTE